MAIPPPLCFRSLGVFNLCATTYFTAVFQTAETTKLNDVSANYYSCVLWPFEADCGLSSFNISGMVVIIV